MSGLAAAHTSPGVLWAAFSSSHLPLLPTLALWAGLRTSLILAGELKGNIFWNVFFHTTHIPSWCKGPLSRLFFFFTIDFLAIS